MPPVTWLNVGAGGGRRARDMTTSYLPSEDNGGHETCPRNLCEFPQREMVYNHKNISFVFFINRPQICISEKFMNCSFFFFFSFSGTKLLSSSINSFLATDTDNKCINSKAWWCSLINSYIYLVCSICHFWLVSEPRLFVSMVTWSIMWKAIKIIIFA